MVGLNFDFLVLNLTKHSSYLIYNAALYFSPVIQRQYHEKYGFGEVGLYPFPSFLYQLTMESYILRVMLLVLNTKFFNMVKQPACAIYLFSFLLTNKLFLYFKMQLAITYFLPKVMEIALNVFQMSFCFNYFVMNKMAGFFTHYNRIEFVNIAGAIIYCLTFAPQIDCRSLAFWCQQWSEEETIHFLTDFMGALWDTSKLT